MEIPRPRFNLQYIAAFSIEAARARFARNDRARSREMIREM
jgi:hypothetical protein